MKVSRSITTAVFALAFALLVACAAPKSQISKDIKPALPEKQTSVPGMAADEQKGAAGTGQAGKAEAEKVPDVPSKQKLIRSVDASLEVRQLDQTVARCSKETSALGGYVSQQNVTGSPENTGTNERRSAQMTLRVPADKLDQLLQLIRSVGNVLQYEESTRDVTLSYVDTESHVKSLRIEQSTLTDMLGKATDLNQIIALQERLAQVRYEIESYESRLRTMDNQITYSTVTLSLIQVKQYTEAERVSFAAEASRQLSAGWNAFLRALRGAALGILAILPFLLILIALFLLWFFVWRPRSLRRKEQKANAATGSKPACQQPQNAGSGPNAGTDKTVAPRPQQPRRARFTRVIKRTKKTNHHD